MRRIKTGTRWELFLEVQNQIINGLNKDVEYHDIAPEEQLILCDAITSGGLLIAINPSDAEKYVQALKDEGHDSWIIGEVADKQDKLIIVNK